MTWLKNASRDLGSDATDSTVTEYAAVGALIAIAAPGASVGLAGQVQESCETSERSWQESVR